MPNYQRADLREISGDGIVMETTVEIAGHELIVEYDFKITAHGNPGVAPSLSYPGDPPEPAEFTIEILGLRFPKQHADVPELTVPEWLKDILSTHLAERDDINAIIQKADYERGSYDPNDERI